MEPSRSSPHGPPSVGNRRPPYEQLLTNELGPKFGPFRPGDIRISERANGRKVPRGSHRLDRLELPIETPRLILRLPSTRDVPDLRRSFRNPLTARAVGAPLHSTSEMRNPALMVARTLREFRNAEHLSLSIVLREENVCIGRAGLRGLDWMWRKVESLSYWIDPAFWNRGLATESSRFLCQTAFTRLGMRRIGS